MSHSAFPDGFEEMIVNKRYHELNAFELKQLSDEHISELEYDQIRNTLLSLGNLEEEMPEPSAGLRDKLLDAFDEKTERKPKVIMFRMWSIAATAAALLIAVLLIIKPYEKEMNKGISQINSSDKENSLVNKEPQAEFKSKNIPMPPEVEDAPKKEELTKEESGTAVMDRNEMGANDVDEKLTKTAAAPIEDVEPAKLSETSVGLYNAAPAITSGTISTTESVNENMVLSSNKSKYTSQSASMKNNIDLLSLTVMVY